MATQYNGHSWPITHLNVSVPNVAHNCNQFLSTRNALALQRLQNGKVLDPLQLVVWSTHILRRYVVPNGVCARAEHDLQGMRQWTRDGGIIMKLRTNHRSLLTRAWLFGNFLEGVLLSCGLLSSPDTITCFMAMLELIACRLWSSRLRVGETSELCVIVTWMVNGTGLWRRGCGGNRISKSANPLKCSLWEYNSISRERHTRVTVYWLLHMSTASIGQ